MGKALLEGFLFPTSNSWEAQSNVLEMKGTVQGKWTHATSQA